MAEYVVVDKAKLNGDLETIGNAIRTQTEKTAKLHFPEELEREILSIVKAKPEQEKTVEITENGTVEVTPDLGKVLSKIIANVNVASGGGGGDTYGFEEIRHGSFTLAQDFTNESPEEYIEVEGTAMNKELDLSNSTSVFAFFTKNITKDKYAVAGIFTWQSGWRYRDIHPLYRSYGELSSSSSSSSRIFMHRNDGYNMVGKNIKIGKPIGYSGFFQAGVEYEWLYLFNKPYR